MCYTFAASSRIRLSKEFQQAFVNKGLTNKWFTIYIVNSEHDFPRLGMIVSKRVMSKSVSRNFAKRLIREVFRLNAGNLPALDFFVRIRRNLSRSSATEAKDSLLKLMQTTKA